LYAAAVLFQSNSEPTQHRQQHVIDIDNSTSSTTLTGTRMTKQRYSYRESQSHCAITRRRRSASGILVVRKEEEKRGGSSRRKTQRREGGKKGRGREFRKKRGRKKE
jgi:hypothetical protein